MYILTMTASRKRNHLPLEKKVEVIRSMQRKHLTLTRPGELFNCGKSQIAFMQKDKESLLSSYEALAAGSRVHTKPSARTSEYAATNKALYQWYNIACLKNVYSHNSQKKPRRLLNDSGKTISRF